MRPFAVLLAAALLAALVAAPSSHAYKLGGKKWPTRTITYHSAAPQLKAEIAGAAAAWNASGVRLRFKAVPKRKAKLRIVYAHKDAATEGEATLGYVKTQTVRVPQARGVPVSGVPCGGRVRWPNGTWVKVTCPRVTYRPMMWLKRMTPQELRDPFHRNEMRKVVAHEFGHVLGLDHQRNRCAVMSYERDFVCPEPPNPWQMRCRTLHPDDIQGAIRRYGGTMKALEPEFCDLAAAPVPPVELNATFDTQTYELTVTWRASTAPEGRRLMLGIANGPCPAEPSPFLTESVTPGGTGSISANVYDGGGRYCISAWTEDVFGRLSTPATTFIAVPEL